MFTLSGVVSHSSTPIRIFEHTNGLSCYFVGNGEVHYGLLLPYVRDLASQYHSEAPPVVLYDGMNTAMLEPLRIIYLPKQQVIEVKTFYSEGKPYVFVIDEDNQVWHQRW